MSQIDKIISIAKNEIGVKEYPANSNHVKYNDEYYGSNYGNYAWCCVFVWWVFKKSGLSNLFFDGEKTAYCPTVKNWAVKNGIFSQNGEKGDLILFNFSGGTTAEHIGICTGKLNNDVYYSIEGNTGSGNEANGGAVMQRTRYKANIVGFVKIKYQEEKALKEITSVNDIVWELSARNIITDKALWLKKLDEDKNAYWLAKKTIDYLIKKGE